MTTTHPTEQDTAVVAPSAAELTIAANRERLAAVVQAVGERPPDISRRRGESLLVFAAFTLVYFLIGLWVVGEMKVVGFDSLDRFNRALMMWHNEPAKLAAIGFDYPPLSVIAISPFAMFSSLVSSLVVVPLASAVFAALMMVSLNTLMRRADITWPFRYAVLLALGANPLLVLYATTGSHHLMWVAFVTTAIGALCAWYITADVRFILVAGLVFAVAAGLGYVCLVWFVFATVMVIGVLARLRADGTEIEGTAVGFAAPALYVVALWTLFNWLILDDPFRWITNARGNPGDSLADPSITGLLASTWQLVLDASPIALLVLPALVVVGVARNNGLALWLAAMLLLAIFTPMLSVLLRMTDSPMQMRDGLIITVLAVVGAVWLARSSGSRGDLVAILLVLGLVLSVPWTLEQMRSYPYQGAEQAFADAVATRTSQEGAVNPRGETVGIAAELDMATFIRENISTPSSVLTDNSQTFGVMVMTGHPELFFDRVDRGDGAWRHAARSPADGEDRVTFMLLSASTDVDLLSQFYPGAAQGADPLLPVVHRNERYVLVNVPATYDRSKDSTVGEPKDEQ